MRYDRDRVKSGVDIVAVISDYVRLRRFGKRYSGLCPFHKEKTPSFSVSAEHQNFKCFGCDAKGDVFTFVMNTEGLAFADAIQRVAVAAGIPPEEDTRTPADRKRWEQARAAAPTLAADAVDWIHGVRLEAVTRKAELMSLAEAAWAAGYDEVGDNFAAMVELIPRVALDPEGSGGGVIVAAYRKSAVEAPPSETRRLLALGRADRENAEAATRLIVEMLAEYQRLEVAAAVPAEVLV